MYVFKPLHQTYYPHEVWKLNYHYSSINSLAEIETGELNVFQRGYRDMYKTNLSINPFPNKPLFIHVCSTNLLKTPWEKEKVLVTNTFSFSYSFIYLLRAPSAIFIKFKIVGSANSFSLEEFNIACLRRG